MRKRKVFRRIFIYYALLLILAIFFIEFYITRVVRESYIENYRKDLVIQTNIVEDLIDFRSPEALHDIGKKIKRDTGSRITIISPDGVVLGDSDREAATLDNHRNRPEIQQSLIGETGWSVRHSDTLNVDLLYVAKKVEREGMVQGFIRLAIPLEHLSSAINILRFKILFAVVFVLVATGLLMVWQTNRIRRLFLQISEFSRRIAEGSLDRKLFLSGAGEFEEVAGHLNTMSEVLKKNRERQEEETDRLNVMLKSIPDALVIMNSQGIIEQSNEVFRNLFHDNAPDGRPIFEIVRNPELFSLLDTVRNTPGPGMSEVRTDLPEERYLEVLVSPLFYKEHEPAGFVAIFHDTTHLKRLEQMRKDFVANVSHEIRTPVTAIKGFAETLLDGALDERENAKKFLNTIKSHSERLNRLVEDLLTISRLELGVIRIEKKPVKVSLIIDAVIDIIRSNADLKGLYLKKTLQDGDLDTKADRDRVVQILINLLDNAIKFTEHGGIEIGASGEGTRRCLFVRDTGIGVPGKYISRLGERFFRVDPSRSRELGGTGLGLAIVKHLVRAHGWEMKITSEEGKGTEVMIFIA